MLRADQRPQTAWLDVQARTTNPASTIALLASVPDKRMADSAEAMCAEPSIRLASAGSLSAKRPAKRDASAAKIENLAGLIVCWVAARALTVQCGKGHRLEFAATLQSVRQSAGGLFDV